ncbi:TPA_exp: hypothetical protein A8136_0593 [Trichophyton benhamiae CBS 112371]|nr:TPA_exp: hypothetical protein A8136_0593 [Trichophyton benhamiae CBS 112371]
MDMLQPIGTSFGVIAASNPLACACVGLKCGEEAGTNGTKGGSDEHPNFRVPSLAMTAHQQACTLNSLEPPAISQSVECQRSKAGAISKECITQGDLDVNECKPEDTKDDQQCNHVRVTPGAKQKVRERGLIFRV